MATIDLSQLITAEDKKILAIDQYRIAIQNHIDSAARSRNYDNGNSLASYVSSTNSDWSNEALTFIAWRDAVWVYVYGELDKVLNGTREIPTIEEFIEELPNAWND